MGSNRRAENRQRSDRANFIHLLSTVGYDAHYARQLAVAREELTGQSPMYLASASLSTGTMSSIGGWTFSGSAMSEDMKQSLKGSGVLEDKDPWWKW